MKRIQFVTPLEAVILGYLYSCGDRSDKRLLKKLRRKLIPVAKSLMNK